MQPDEPSPLPEPPLATIEAAAARLTIKPEALRARCRRAAQRTGDETTARLGGGIVAFKFGATWRIRFPRE
jgi:hypothetical protein